MQNPALKIVELMGGTGNQMFQYAFALAVARAQGTPVLCDIAGLGCRPGREPPEARLQKRIGKKAGKDSVFRVLPEAGRLWDI